MKINLDKGTVGIKVTKYGTPSTITTLKYVDGDEVEKDSIAPIGGVEVRLTDGATAELSGSGLEGTITDGLLWFDKFIRDGEVCWSLFAYDDTVDIDTEISAGTVPNFIREFLR